MQRYILLFLLSLSVQVIFAQSKATTHQVVKGETLYSLAKRYNVTVEAIQKANKVLATNPKLKLGQKLVIPKASTAKANSTKAAAHVDEAKTETVEKAASTKSEPKAKAGKGESVKSKPEAKSAKSESKETAKPGATKAEFKPAATAQDISKSGIHIVAKGETIYSLAWTYGVPAAKLKEANDLGDDMKLKIGQKLIIPAKNPEAMFKVVPKEERKAEAAPAVDPKDQPGREYIPTDNKPLVEKKPEPVKKKEDSFVVKEGRVINIPASKAAPEPTKKDESPAWDPTKESSKQEDKQAKVEAAKSEVVKNDRVNPTDYSAVFNNYVSSGKKKSVYRGIGTFLKSENPGNQYLALYNYADMGTILKVTNLMSKQSVYVKVIGKVPSVDTQNEVILKVSSEAAAQLKVAEDKFLVEVTGYNP
jgi:LysM repeat protein